MDKQLEIIVKESGLDKSKSDILLQNFKDYFEIAGDWEKKAKMLVVTNENQTTEMKMAREGRLFLREKRIAIENSRKALKEQSLREGKAIDGIANVLKALIIPIEEYLDQQEHFVEIRKSKEEELLQIEAEKKAEAERLAQEEAERKEQERIRLENIKLQKEAVERERKIFEERELANAKLKAEQDANEKIQAEIRAKAEAEKAKAEELARFEKEKADKIILEERAKAEKERLEREKMQKLLDEQIECPFCHKKFNKEVNNGKL